MTCTRRELLAHLGTGLGLLGLATLLEPARAATDPLAPRTPHFPPKAKHVIHIYLNGGPSQVDTFDPKPLLAKYAGKKLPSGNLSTERPTGGALAAPFKFQRYGKNGIGGSEIFSKTAG